MVGSDYNLKVGTAPGLEPRTQPLTTTSKEDAMAETILPHPGSLPELAHEDASRG